MEQVIPNPNQASPSPPSQSAAIPPSPSHPVSQTTPQQASPQIKSPKFSTLIIALVLFLLAGGLALAYFGKIGQGKKEAVGPQKPPSAEGTEAETKPEKLPPIITVSKYEKDSDSDSVPEFIEEAIGTDPNVDDCALEVGCGKTAGVKPKPVNVFFIFDSSGSMAGQVSGARKIDIAKQAMKSYIDKLPAEINSGLMVYGHKGNNTVAGKSLSCAGIETLYPLGRIDKVAYKSKIDSCKPTGWTPIAASFQKAQAEFLGKEDDINRLVLVSDGIETCGGDPCDVAKQLKTTGIDPIIDVIGFDVDQAAREQLSCIAQVTGGQYFDVHSAEEFNQAVDKLGENAKNLAEAGSCLAEHEAEYFSCLVDIFRRVLDYINERVVSPDVSSEERSQLMTVQRKVSQRSAELIRKTSGQTTTDIDKLLQKYKSPFPTTSNP